MTGTATTDSKSQNDQLKVLTVEQLNLTIKQFLEGQVGVIWVQGEISNFKAHTSGHFYFSLKDSKSQISAVMFRGHNSRLKFKPTDGLQVIVRGRISVYEPRGTYNILCDSMEPVGAGALQKAFEQLKEKLRHEGLFDSARKKKIPPFPKQIAVVTSPTGAAIRDILNILSRRAPNVEVTVVPALVQGESATNSLREAFLRAQKIPALDVIIIGRGGGSMEDLWCFNDEGLARLIANSSVPVISAVGHEVDFTISDFVSDLRAPTPSAAAELVAKSHGETLSKIENLYRMLNISFARKYRGLADRARHLSRLLVDPKKRVQDFVLKNDDLFDRLSLAFQNLIRDRRYQIEISRERLKSPQQVLREKTAQREVLFLRLAQSCKQIFQRKNHRLSQQMSLLNSLSPLGVVDRGYSIALKNEKVVRSYKNLKEEDLISLVLSEGQAVVQVKSLSKENSWTLKKN